MNALTNEERKLVHGALRVVVKEFKHDRISNSASWQKTKLRQAEGKAHEKLLNELAEDILHGRKG